MSSMRYINILIITAALLFPLASAAIECRGHIFFYEVSTGEFEDAEDDYWYYYNKLATLLPDKGISFSIHTGYPIKAMTCFGTLESVSRDDLDVTLGYVYIRPDGLRKIDGGVSTGVDVLNSIEDFFD